ncbi:CHASE2 domain-containing protein [Spirulina major CS-329]|uniref:CHASE2 domain-containing protein n=1 Tax=Spirulina TaxID=1154 RepID=UPI00232D6F47|nr:MULTISPECIES: CHASE2 domain-containing protein [Spirulina]MDB9494805.1 CHASE2 domain-containing protein [Spirulina subsalsa CS-330]MDB9502628.1 CHASE2 domain-containing protein [Spirulina major CS-329]
MLKPLRRFTSRLLRQQSLFVIVGSVTLLVIGIRWTGILQGWEWAVWDALVRSRPPATAPEDRIMIIKVEESDLQKYDYPLSDGDVAALLDIIAAAQPNVIGLDIYRGEAREPGHNRLMNTIQRLPNLVVIEQLEDDEKIGIDPPPAATPEQVGFNNVVIDADGVIRRSIFFWHLDGEVKTSFSVRVAEAYLAANQGEGLLAGPEQRRWGRQPALSPGRLGEQTVYWFEPNHGPYVRADAQGYQVVVNPRNPAQFKTVTMEEVMTGAVPAEQMRDRIILIGYTANSVKDYFNGPYSAELFQAPTQFSGVEFHANFISQMISAELDQWPLIRFGWGEAEWLWILLWAGVGGGIVWKVRSPLGYTTLLLGSAALLGSIVYGALLVGWWLPLVPPLLGMGSAAIILTSYLAYQEEEFKRSTEFLRSIIDNIPDPIFVKDPTHRWMIFNQAFCDFSGYERSQILGKTNSEIFTAAESEQFNQEEAWVFEHQTPRETEEKYTSSDGITYLSATKRSLHKDAAGNVFLVGVIHDITERKRIEEELRRTTAELTRSNSELQKTQTHLQRLAYYDSLTGLANRKSFFESLKASLNWGRDNGKLVGLLYLDLDGFKAVNDSLGHHVGDLLLQAVAKRITHCLRDSDIVARLGGDEFTVILPGIKKHNDTGIVSEKIISTLAQPYQLEDHEVGVTVSIGSSLFPKDGETEEVLINKADHAMYCAKNGGRNQHQMAD